eukprot:6984014-Prymnesium_polylepis.1
MLDRVELLLASRVLGVHLCDLGGCRPEHVGLHADAQDGDDTVVDDGPAARAGAERVPDAARDHDGPVERSE